MALTATATSSTRKYVCQKLGMLNPTIVSEPPNKLNIKYVVEKNDRSVDELMTPLVEEVRERSHIYAQSDNFLLDIQCLWRGIHVLQAISWK